MKADHSRNTFRPEQHYRDVLKQQGRVDVDADWNEQQAINVTRVETETIDVVGRTGAPLHAGGFQIVADGATLRIGAGRFYVDGLLCENEDDKLDYRTQPHRWDIGPVGDELRAAKATAGLVYLDVWLRHITALHDPLIREVALGGPDTATRTQIVWQVRILPVPRGTPDREQIAALQTKRTELQTRLAAVLAAGGDSTAIVQELAQVNLKLAELNAASSTAPLTCDSVVPAWNKLIDESSGRLNARTASTPATTDLCELPPRAGFQRTENQLYRVEVHHGGAVGEATFKWSRDNGSVATSVESVAGQAITVASVGPDEVLGFAANHWIELLDDANELAGTAGSLLQIEHVPSGSRILSMKTTPSAVDLARNPLVRRWDQSGATASPNGVAITGEWQPLEDGVEVQFTGGPFRTGDYWLIPARVATGDVEWPPFELPNTSPLPQPRRGIAHHFARLAVVELDRETLKVTADCRKLFPPLTEISAPPAPPPTPPAAPPKAMNVNGTSWQNDAPLAFAEFVERGLFVDFDRRVAPASVSLKTMIVTLELPIVPDTGFEGGTANREIVPRLAVILFGEITVAENQVRWLPLRSGLQSLATFFRGLQQVLGRVTLKGPAIWSDDEEALHLDGRAFGEPARDGAAPRTALGFPSGGTGRASDFESWFLLALPVELGGFTIAPLNVRLVQRENTFVFAALEGGGDPVEVVGTITLSAPATADLVIPIRAIENRELVELPESVTVAAGRAAVRFLIAPGRRPPDGAARVPITALAAGAELTVVLTIGRG